MYIYRCINVCVCEMHFTPKPQTCRSHENPQPKKKHKPFTFWGFKRAPCSDVHGKDALAIPQRCQAISDQRSRGWWSSSLGIVGWTQSSPQHSPRACAWCFAAAAAGGGIVGLDVVLVLVLFTWRLTTLVHKSNVKLSRQFFMYCWSSATQILLIYFICVFLPDNRHVKSLKSQHSNSTFKEHPWNPSRSSIDLHHYWVCNFYPKHPQTFPAKQPKIRTWYRPRRP